MSKTIHIVFGERASRDTGDFDALLGDLKNYEGAYVVRTFDTDKECEAYLQALDDLNGWNDYAKLEDCHTKEEIEEFDKRYDEAGI